MLIDGTDGIAIPYIFLKEAVADGIRGLNVLGLILFCFVFGGIMAQMGIFQNLCSFNDKSVSNSIFLNR